MKTTKDVQKTSEKTPQTGAVTNPKSEGKKPTTDKGIGTPKHVANLPTGGGVLPTGTKAPETPKKVEEQGKYPEGSTSPIPQQGRKSNAETITLAEFNDLKKQMEELKKRPALPKTPEEIQAFLERKNQVLERKTKLSAVLEALTQVGKDFESNDPDIGTPRITYTGGKYDNDLFSVKNPSVIKEFNAFLIERIKDKIKAIDSELVA